MAIQGLSLTERNWYVCNQDPGKKETLEESKEAGATVFYWKPIANAQMARIHDMVASSTLQMGDMTTQTFHQRNAARNREAFRYACSGWDNFFDEHEEPIEYVSAQAMEGGRIYHVVSDEVMDCIPLAVVNEVGAHIFNSNTMGDEQRKKFEAQLLQSGGSPAGIVPSVGTTSASSEDAGETHSTSEGKKTKGKLRTKRGK